MKIYGVAFLAICFLTGKFLGRLLGELIEINGDIGGVGFAMLFLMLGGNYMRKKGWFSTKTESGIGFWSAMYIPIIVAMAATQNVKAAFTGGWIAVIAGIGTTLLVMAMVPVISKIGKNQNKENNH